MLIATFTESDTGTDSETDSELNGYIVLYRTCVEHCTDSDSDPYSLFLYSDVFPLPDSDSYTDSYSDSYSNGYFTNVQKCVHCTYADSYSGTIIVVFK